MTTSQDDPLAKALIAEVRRHLADGFVAGLAEDLEAIESLDAAANPPLKVKLDLLRKEVARRIDGVEPGGSTSPAGVDEYTDQRTRFQMIEAEITSADDDSLNALLAEVATLTKLSVIERAWMSDQIEAEIRRR